MWHKPLIRWILRDGGKIETTGGGGGGGGHR